MGTPNGLYDGGSNLNNNNNNNNNPGVVGSCRSASVAVSLTSQSSAPTGEAHIPPLLGVAPLGPVALSKEQQVTHTPPLISPSKSRSRNQHFKHFHIQTKIRTSFDIESKHFDVNTEILTSKPKKLTNF